jgi:hypothetical protein
MLEIEDILKNISLLSNTRNNRLFDIKERNNQHLLKKHYKKSEKKYLMNEIILTFEDPQLNTIRYNLFHEAKIFNEECGYDNYDPILYKPPKFLSF